MTLDSLAGKPLGEVVLLLLLVGEQLFVLGEVRCELSNSSFVAKLIILCSRVILLEETRDVLQIS